MAAELLRHHEPEQPQLAHLVHDVDREVLVPIPLRNVRGDLALGEITHDLAEGFVVLGQFEAHRLSCSSP